MRILLLNAKLKLGSTLILAFYCLINCNGCTSYSKSHVVKWTGAFMIDSITAGAIQLEYTSKIPIGNTFASSSTYGINQRLFTYNFKTEKLTKVADLSTDMSDVPWGNHFDFNYPNLAYETIYRGSRASGIFDLSGNKNILFTPIIGFLSSSNKYFVDNSRIMDLKSKVTTAILNTEADLFYFDDNTNTAFGMVTALRQPPYSIVAYQGAKVTPETLGVLKYWDRIGRSRPNGDVFFRIYTPTKVGELRLSSLQSGKVEFDSLDIGSIYNGMNSFDYDSISGNSISISFATKDQLAGLTIANLYGKFQATNISANIQEDY